MINKATFNQISARFGDLMSPAHPVPGPLPGGPQGPLRRPPRPARGHPVRQVGQGDQEGGPGQVRQPLPVLRRLRGGPQERRGQVPLHRPEPGPDHRGAPGRGHADSHGAHQPDLQPLPPPRAGPLQEPQQEDQPRHRGRGDRARQVRDRGSPGSPHALGAQRPRPRASSPPRSASPPGSPRRAPSPSRPPTRAT